MKMTIYLIKENDNNNDTRRYNRIRLHTGITKKWLNHTIWEIRVYK